MLIVIVKYTLISNYSLILIHYYLWFLCTIKYVHCPYDYLFLNENKKRFCQKLVFLKYSRFSQLFSFDSLKYKLDPIFDYEPS